MKLVIYDPAWPLYEPLLRNSLRTPWEIACADNDPGWLARQVNDADALIALKLPPELRGAARRLKIFNFPGAGVMHSRTDELPEGCALCNVYEHEIPIAEYTMMAVFLHVTRALDYRETFRRGRWDGNGRIGGEMHDEAWGKTLGLVGYGHIGQAVAARAQAFGMKVAAICEDPGTPLPPGAPRPEWLGSQADLPRLMAQSDFLVIACPVTAATLGMIGARELALMHPSAVLINVSRAEVVQEEPLFNALRDGRIAGAALDVWYQYPEEPQDVLHGSRLPFHELKNVFATPHLSAWTHAMVERRMQNIAANLDRLSRGEPIERVVFVGTWRAGQAVTA
ncbi:MAG: 2-hydroxyacid dehydrogenase [Bryobacteraceae bacterium]